jgi:hypothetical protein
MDVKIGEQPKIKFELRPAAPVNIHLETKYIRGGDAVTSKSVARIVTLSEVEYSNLVASGKIEENTLYLIPDE